MEIKIIIFIIIALVLIPLIIYLNHKSQSSDDNKEDILKELKSKGLELVDITIPKLFDTGPFPKFKVSIGPQTQVMGVRGGKSSRYRIVKYKDKKGREHESWLKIEITAFVVVNMEWSPKLKKG